MTIPLDYEILRVTWWLILGVLLIGFAVMDGFDLGVAMLLPYVARSDAERRVTINSIGPFWEGNQVWLSDAEWRRIEPLLPKGRRGAHRVDDRRVISGIKHMLHSGERWRDFRRIRAELDPQGMFLNDYLRKLFDTDSPVPTEASSAFTFISDAAGIEGDEGGVS